jgi:formimidoylglutamate deiminase
MTARDKSAGSVPAASEKPAGAPAPKETGWLPDCVYTGETFESGLAFFADSLGRITRFSREPADLAAAKRLPGQAALPGLVNTHSHVWPRVLRGRVGLRSRADRDQAGGHGEALDRALGRLAIDDIYDTARMTFIEMLLAGITCVGEGHFLHRQPDGTPWPEPLLAAREILRAARETGIRIALLNGAWVRADFGQPAGSAPARCLTATADEFIRETEGLRDYIEKNLPGDEAWTGVAPHSLGAVPLDFLKTVAAYAHTKRFRLHLRLGEQAAEAAACAAEYGRGPAALLAEHGLLDKRFTAVHGTHLGDDDIRILGAARVTVCACPGADGSSDDGGIPTGKLLAAGVALALGTGGRAQANGLEAGRLLEFQLRSDGRRAALWPGDGAASLFHAATVAGARSLGAPSGALEVGRPADFFTVNLYDPSLAGASPETLLPAIVFAASPRAVREVWVGARQRVGQWRHPLQSPAITRFAEMQKRLWGE